LLFNANSAFFQLPVYHGENKLIFNEMMMSSALYKTNTLSWIFIVLLFNVLRQIFHAHSIQENRIGGVMVSMLTSSAVDRGFEPQSGQTKDYEIGICCFSEWRFSCIECA
jgi:hypothetical protein